MRKAPKASPGLKTRGGGKTAVRSTMSPVFGGRATKRAAKSGRSGGRK